MRDPSVVTSLPSSSTNQQDFDSPLPQRYTPVTFDANIFLDPELKDEEKVNLALAQIYRFELMYERDEATRNQIADRIRTSKFATPRGVHRDHARRSLKKMQTNPAVLKYAGIYFLKRELNTEHRIIFHFTDRLPDSLEVKDLPTKKNLTVAKSQYDWQEIMMVKSYLQNSTVFSSANPTDLLEVAQVASGELVKGMVYTEMMHRRALRSTGQGLRNPIGYLCSCFDATGKFKYKDTHLRYLSADTSTTTNDAIEFELEYDHFTEFDSKMNARYANKVKFFYHKENGKVYIKQMLKAGRVLNPRTWLKKFDIPFRVVNLFAEVSE